MMRAEKDPGEPKARTQRQPTTIFDFASLLLRKRTLLGVIFAATLIPSLVILPLLPNQYRSNSTILPAIPATPLSGLSAIVGLARPQLQDESSSDLYPEIIRSRQIAEAVIRQNYTVTDGDAQKTLTLTEYFDEDNIDKLYGELADITSVATNKTTGTITVSVETDYPELSQAILNTYLADLEHYNLVSRRSKAKDVEQYLARELAVRKKELMASQDTLKSFQERNLNWNESSNPYLLQELATLQREVTMKEQAYAYLSQEFEASKLKVQMDTPIIRILDTPNLPELKSSPFRLQILIVIGLLTLLLAILTIAVAENFRLRAADRENDSYAGFRQQFATVFPTLSRRLLPEYTGLTDDDNPAESPRRRVLILTKQEKSL